VADSRQLSSTESKSWQINQPLPTSISISIMQVFITLNILKEQSRNNNGKNERNKHKVALNNSNLKSNGWETTRPGREGVGGAHPPPERFATLRSEVCWVAEKRAKYKGTPVIAPQKGNF